MKKILLTSACLLVVFVAMAQDPQFSQFYANPLYLNPAFAGAAQTSRATINYRNQWPALSANYITSVASFDTHIEKYNSGVGLMVLSDAQFSNLRSTDIGLQYSYQLKINEDNFVRLGLQGSYVNRSAGFYNLVFNYDPGTFRPITDDPIKNNTIRAKYLDFSTGALFYNTNFWLSASVHHINQPDQSVVNGTRQPLPMKATLSMGYKFIFGEGVIGNGLGADMDKEASITPAVLYKKQGQFDQLDVGVYFTYSPLVLGAWYRGLPIKQYKQGISNHDAVIGLIGYRADNFSFGYSYDFTISSLGAASGGSHEISVSYQFEGWPKPPKNRKSNKKQMACPKF